MECGCPILLIRVNPWTTETERGCRFNNCTHTHEPGCAVLAAVEQGEIALSRYTSYLSILDEDPNNKYRKPF